MDRMRSKIFGGLAILLALLLVVAAALWWYFLAGRENVPADGEGGEPLLAVAQHLEIPWALDFLPDGSIVLTERPGRLRIIKPTGELKADPLYTVPDVAPVGEGGLLGIAVHPDFEANGYIYIYYTYDSGGGLANRVLRLLYNGGQPVPDKTIIVGIPGAGNHNGGRLKFGPDGKLYITTGDATNASLAQDTGSLAGKILRLNEDGTVPADNPFPGSPVYSYGHRNPQGLAWDSLGRLWATEHGQSATDELNLIVAGQNYGWPVIRGDETAPGMQSPVVHSGSLTWAPSGMVFLDGYLYFAGLRGQSIFRMDVNDPAKTPTRLFEGDFGRVRDIVVGPDGYLYIITSNRDGRAIPSGVDDQLIRIDPQQLP